jgi:maltooligosyltrehalose synthase
MAAARWGKKNVKPSHPRDADHPDHEKYLKKLRAGVKRRYANMTDEQKRATIAPALAARKAVAA